METQSPTKCQPIDFLIIGAMKCGTSSLFNYLCSHPSVVSPKKKEIRFFEREDRYEKGIEYYHSHWPVQQVKGFFYRGEASPSYTCPDYNIDNIAQRIFNYSDQLKMIFLVRHPIERILSHWRHGNQRVPEKFPFFETDIENEQYRKLFIDRTLYFSIIKVYLKYFSSGQIKIVFFEDLIKEPLRVSNQIESFLGFSARTALTPFPNINVSSKADRPIDTKVTDKLLAELSADIQNFLSFVGKSQDYWNLDVGVEYSV